MSLACFIATNKKSEDIVLNDQLLVIRHLTLEGDGKTALYVIIDGEEEEKVLLATLSANIPQHTMEVPISGEKINFICKGTGKVHIVGNFEEEEEYGNDDFDDYMSDEDEEDDDEVPEDFEEEEPEPVPMKAPKQKKENKKKH